MHPAGVRFRRDFWGQEAELTDEQKQGYIDQVKATQAARLDLRPFGKPVKKPQDRG